MEANIKSKKEIQNNIKQELATILMNVNPLIHQKALKKSIKKASKILYRGSTKGRKNKIKVENIE